MKYRTTKSPTIRAERSRPSGNEPPRDARRKVTAADVAKLASVSQSAVSRYFTPGGSVSKKTADAIKKAATELAYRPNDVARSLITGRSYVVGLIVAYLENQYYPKAIELISRRLRRAGYNLQIFISSQDGSDADRIVEDILACQLEGIIVASVTLSSDIVSACQARDVPVVLFNRSQDDLRVSSVTSDNMNGGYRVAKHFAECGYQRIGYIAGLENVSTQRDREAGFLKGLADAGLQLFARECGRFNYEDAAVAARRMFQARIRPDCVFVANDHMALAVMDVLRHELNIKVPADVAVVGYDDSTPSGWPSYNLTTIQQPSERMADKTVELLLYQIEHGVVHNERILIEGALVVRGSTSATARIQ